MSPRAQEKGEGGERRHHLLCVQRENQEDVEKEKRGGEGSASCPRNSEQKGEKTLSILF